MTATLRGPRIARAALTAAVAWLGLGTALSLLASSAPHSNALIPRFLTALPILIGWPLGRWAGHRNGIESRGAWARLWVVTIGLVFLGLAFIGCADALATYG
jgi:hypothetical protein